MTILLAVDYLQRAVRNTAKKQKKQKTILTPWTTQCLFEGYPKWFPVKVFTFASLESVLWLNPTLQTELKMRPNNISCKSLITCQVAGPLFSAQLWRLVSSGPAEGVKIEIPTEVADCFYYQSSAIRTAARVPQCLLALSGSGTELDSAEDIWWHCQRIKMERNAVGRKVSLVNRK